MAKPVTGQTTFGSNTTGTTTQLDNNFLLAYNALNDLNTYANFLTDTGSANTVIVTLAANLTGALTNGLIIQVKVAATNTTASTLNYNAGGALNILNLDGTALVAGQLVTGAICSFQYRASDTSWLLQTPALVPAVAATGGGSMVLLSTVQANANTAINFNNLISSSYPAYRLVLSGLKVAGNDSSLILRVGNGNTPTYQSTLYQWSSVLSFNSGVTLVQSSGGNAAATGLTISAVAGGGAGIYNGANSAFSSQIDFSVLANANAPAQMTFRSDYVATSSTQQAAASGGGYWNHNSVITSVQIVPSNANITSGNVSLYGFKP